MTSRTLTVAFTDIVGSTELLVRLGERNAERLRLAHFATLSEQIEHARGREVKNLGDGVMAAFEAARDGIECAVAIQHAWTRHVGASSRAPVAIRIGLSSGDVRLEKGDCFGTSVIEASRLCARAAGGQVLLADSTHMLARDYGPIGELGALELKGLPEPTRVWEAHWSPDTPAPVRAVLADDAVLVREGIAHVLEAAGIDVVGQVSDGEALLRVTGELRPDLAIVDVRMPPTHTTEGVEAAERIRNRHPGTGVLLLTQEVQPHYASRLLGASPTGVGYLLKESVTDLRGFAEAARRVAAGGTAFDSALAPVPELEPLPSTRGRHLT